MRKMLTDRTIRALKLSPGERIEWWDTVIPAFGLRASATAKTFVLAHRFGGRNPVRLKLGRYPMISLERGREKAAQWIQMLEHGRDPRVELERERVAEARKRADTFSAVAQVFIEQKLRKERQGKDAERTLRRFIEAWSTARLRTLTGVTSARLSIRLRLKRHTWRTACSPSSSGSWPGPLIGTSWNSLPAPR